MISRFWTLFIIPAWLVACGGPVAGYDPQCAVDAAQKCMAEMQKCKVDEEVEEVE